MTTNEPTNIIHFFSPIRVVCQNTFATPAAPKRVGTPLEQALADITDASVAHLEAVHKAADANEKIDALREQLNDLIEQRDTAEKQIDEQVEALRLARCVAAELGATFEQVGEAEIGHLFS